MSGSRVAVLQMLVPQSYVVPLCFSKIFYGNLTLLEFLFQVGEGNAAILRGGGLPVMEGGGQFDDS